MTALDGQPRLATPLPSVELRFPAPTGRVLSTNESYARNWQARRRVLAPWREEVGWAWQRLPRPLRTSITGVPCRVQVTIGFRTAARRDPSNYVGTVVKALVLAKVHQVNTPPKTWSTPTQSARLATMVNPRLQLVEQGVWPDDSPAWVSVDEPVCTKGGDVVVRLVPR